MFVCCVKLAELMISISRTTLIFFQPVQLGVRSCVLSSSRTCISVLCQNSWKGRAYLWGGGGGDWISYSLFGNSSSVLGREEGGLGSGFCVCLLYVCVCVCVFVCVCGYFRASVYKKLRKRRKKEERERESVSSFSWFLWFISRWSRRGEVQMSEDGRHRWKSISAREVRKKQGCQVDSCWLLPSGRPFPWSDADGWKRFADWTESLRAPVLARGILGKLVDFTARPNLMTSGWTQCFIGAVHPHTSSWRMLWSHHT